MTSHEIALTFAEKFQNEYPNTPIYLLMEELRKAIDDYVEEQVNSGDLADVGGALRELADKYEMDALDRYETGDHALSHLHMAAQARYGFEDGWKAAKKQ